MPPEFVDIQSVIPDVVVGLKCATPHNFTGQVVYNFSRCRLLKHVAEHLCAVAAGLAPMGIRLKVWDGFRSVAAQWKFWEIMLDERFVSDLRKGGRHTRGTAVDVTLVTQDGREFEMPSAFDDFSEKAHRDYPGASPAAIRHRELLRTLMEKRGFIGIDSRWWHFDFLRWEKYPVLDGDR